MSKMMILETATIYFDCPLVQKEVEIEVNHRVRYGSDGEVEIRLGAGNRCANRDACPIATHRENSTEYDIKRCEFEKNQAGA